ncbi:MAG TPA: dTDP-4-dehydrorhamnose reductase [Nitrospiraceae bacterium]|jgi:dTDP-4-dehydrorhamnose reductase|nr:dTDP-4-dehydrorhamnose reductase [Nitrospiraceae bacterium]
MRLTITGADGQLGHELQAAFQDDSIVPLVWPAFDVLKPDAESQILATEPDVVIHAAAYTNVDQAEKEPDVAMAVNADGTARVARAAAHAGARLLYISTDYVFDGTKRSPYEETDEPKPLNVYGRSKLEGERHALASCKRTLVVRTSWLYGPHGANFVKSIMRFARERSELQVVDDQRGSPTHAGDLAAVLAQFVKKNVYGIAHAAGGGDCTWHELASEIVARMGLTIPVRPISTAEAHRLAARPAYSVLGNRVLAQEGLSVPHWKTAVARFVEEQKKATSEA